MSLEASLQDIAKRIAAMTPDLQGIVQKTDGLQRSVGMLNAQIDQTNRELLKHLKALTKGTLDQGDNPNQQLNTWQDAATTARITEANQLAATRDNRVVAWRQILSGTTTATAIANLTRSFADLDRALTQLDGDHLPAAAKPQLDSLRKELAGMSRQFDNDVNLPPMTRPATPDMTVTELGRAIYKSVYTNQELQGLNVDDVTTYDAPNDPRRVKALDRRDRRLGATPPDTTADPTPEPPDEQPDPEPPPTENGEGE